MADITSSCSDSCASALSSAHQAHFVIESHRAELFSRLMSCDDIHSHIVRGVVPSPTVPKVDKDAIENV